jgi:hypothetical protein
VPALRLCAARETLFGRTPAVDVEAMCRERETLSGRMPERQLNRDDKRELI